jgi:hypothetical protein
VVYGQRLAGRDVYTTTATSYLRQGGEVCAKVAKFENCMTSTLDCRVASLVQLCMYSGVASVSMKNRGKCVKRRPVVISVER